MPHSWGVALRGLDLGLKEPGPEVRRRRTKMVTVETQTDWVDPAAESWATAKLSIFLPVEGCGILHLIVFVFELALD